ncbi:hypothetical protein CPC08DRAFT_730492 [Agrocybe pediades]|nr:hypothetical protein CPC08DRAFT_730492 [Agrocybe pediades]
MPNMMRYAIRPFLNAVMVGTYTDNPIKFPGSIHGELTALVQFLLPIMELEDFAPADFPPQTSWTLLIISRCLHDYVLPLQLGEQIRMIGVLRRFLFFFLPPLLHTFPSYYLLNHRPDIMDHTNRPKRTCRRPERYDQDREAAEEAARVHARRSSIRRRQNTRRPPAPPPDPSVSFPPSPHPPPSSAFRPVYCGRRPQRVSTHFWDRHPYASPFFQVQDGTWDMRIPVPLQGYMHPFLHGLFMYNMPCNNYLKHGEPCFLGWYEGTTGFSCVACRIKWKKKCCKSDLIFPDIIWRRVRPSTEDVSVSGLVFWYTLARRDNLYPEGHNLCHPPSERALPVEVTLLGSVNPFLREPGPYEDFDVEWEAWKRREDSSDSGSEEDDEDGEDDGGDSPDEAEGVGEEVTEAHEEDSREEEYPLIEDTYLEPLSTSPTLIREPLFLPDEDDVGTKSSLSDREIEKAWLKAVLAIEHSPLPLEAPQPRRVDLPLLVVPILQNLCS